MSSKPTYEPALELDEEDMKVELVAVTDESKNAEARTERVEMLIAKVILLGQQRGRPRKDTSDEIAA
ncbi:MAG TPA: hypothetical protein VIG33_10670 [Pseudobdellovibrionaceae bacterium]